MRYIEKLIEKYSETMTLKEINELEKNKMKEKELLKNTRIQEFKKKYEGKCIKKVENTFSGEDKTLIKIDKIEFESWCDDFETLSFKSVVEHISLNDFVEIQNNKIFHLYSNEDYEIIPEEKYNRVKNALKEYLDKIKYI